MKIDQDAVTLSSKILIIAFIILTILANALYLLSYIRAQRVLFRPGHFGKITLALGSIFLALFSYVVQAKPIYADLSGLSCRTAFTSWVYQACFFPFVYGWMIVAMGINVYLNQRQVLVRHANLMSLQVAAVPWILAVVIICPLAFAGVDWKNGCSMENAVERQKARVVIGIILPATVAVLSSILFNSVLSSGNGQQPSSMTLEYSSENSPKDSASAASGKMAVDMPGHAQQQYPPELYAPMDAENEMRATTLTIQQATREKRALLGASLILFFSVMPLAVSYLVYADKIVRSESEAATEEILLIVCQWLFDLYPVLIPITWLSQVQL